MVEAATEFRKSGFTDEDAATLALVATTYQNIADEEISAGDAASFIISQMKAFNIEANNATHIIDAVNEVSNNFAVSSSDLANNLGKVSAALSIGGVSFEETLGLMTAITEITRNSSTAARGLVSIQSRYNQIIDETSSTGQKLIAFYDKHGIALKDQNGQLRNLYDVLGDTANIWDTLDENEQKYFLNIQAGANQSRNLAALMENFGVAISATATALDSSGSAARENAVAMESLEAKIRAFKAAWEELATGTIGKEFLGNIIDTGTAILNFANTDLGQAVTKGLLFGTAMTGLTGIIGGFASNLGNAVKAFRTASTAADVALGVLSKPTWTVVAVSIGVLVGAILALNHAFNDSESAFDRYMSKAEEAAKKSEEYNQKASDAKQRLEELNNIPFYERTQAIQDEILYLEELIRQYERLAEEEKGEATSQYKKAVSDIEERGISYDGGATVDTSSFVNRLGGSAPAIDGLSDSYASLTDAVSAYAEALGISRVAEDGSMRTTQDLQEILAGMGILVTENVESFAESASRIEDYTKSLYDADGATRQEIATNKQFLESNKYIADALQGVIDSGGKLTTEQQHWLKMYNYLANATRMAEQEVDRYEQALKTLREFSDGKPFDSTQENLMALAQALINNSELGIKSVEDLRVALQLLADEGKIDASQIESVVAALMETGAIKAEPEVDVNTDGAIEGIGEVEEQLDNLSSQETILANISTADQAQAMADALRDLNEAVDNLEGKSVNITIDAKAESAISAIDNLKKRIESTTANININSGTASEILTSFQGAEIPDKDFEINCTDKASSVLDKIIRQLRLIKDKTATITIDYDYTGKKATGTNYWGGGSALINDGAPVNGSSAELVVSDGIGRIYNGGEETIQGIPRGAKIYNAADTQKILKDRGLTVKDLDGAAIPAMADGTAGNKYPDYRFDLTYSGVVDLEGSGKTLKENFDEWLKEKKHLLAMDVITEAQYYRDLEIMNERYLKDMAEYQDDYWSHEEEIYEWRNEALEKQLKLEEKLSNLAKAKSQKVLTYTGGRFQYLQNLEAIASAQREVDELKGNYANGTTNARGGLSLVGENGPELRILNRGDGIITANATKNLMSLSKFNIKDIMGVAASNIKQYAFNISNLSLPNVQSPEDFIDGLKNMAYQYSFSRT